MTRTQPARCAGGARALWWRLLRDRTTLNPADTEAAAVVDALRDRRILTGTDGPYHNVIKIRPPMPFDAGNAERLVAMLDEVLPQQHQIR